MGERLLVQEFPSQRLHVHDGKVGSLLADLTLRTDNFLSIFFSFFISTHCRLSVFSLFAALTRLAEKSFFNYDTTTCRLEPVYKYEELRFFSDFS